MNFRLYSKRIKSVVTIVRNSSLNMNAVCYKAEVIDSNCFLSIKSLMALTTLKKRSLSQMLASYLELVLANLRIEFMTVTSFFRTSTLILGSSMIWTNLNKDSERLS